MLHDFLTKEQQYIIRKCDDETVKLAGSKPVSAIIREGWEIFYSQLVELLSMREITFDLEKLNAPPVARR